jgi:hypothetical protein
MLLGPAAVAVAAAPDDLGGKHGQRADRPIRRSDERSGDPINHPNRNDWRFGNRIIDQ